MGLCDRSASWRLALGLCVALVSVAPVGAEAATFVLEGRGFGHGIGMSQFGADGLGRHGWTYQQILGHYYVGAGLAKLERPVRVRVLLHPGVVLSARGQIRMTDTRGRSAVLASGSYRIDRLIRRYRARAPVRFQSRSGLVELDGASYRGVLIAGPAGVINEVRLEDYVRGVVCFEMPCTWSPAALAVQAVAARSYAVASLRPRTAFDLYSDTRSQMYGGVRAENVAGARAVADTAGEVLVWNGRPAWAFYSSSSGGRTAAIRDEWPGASQLPYLVSVPDPYDRPPAARRVVSGAELGRRFGLRPVTSVILRKNGSGRLTSVRLRGRWGERRVAPASIARSFGLAGAWLSIRQRKQGPIGRHAPARTAAASQRALVQSAPHARLIVTPQGSPHRVVQALFLAAMLLGFLVLRSSGRLRVAGATIVASAVTVLISAGSMRATAPVLRGATRAAEVAIASTSPRSDAGAGAAVAPRPTPGLQPPPPVAVRRVPGWEPTPLLPSMPSAPSISSAFRPLSVTSARTASAPSDPLPASEALAAHVSRIAPPAIDSVRLLAADATSAIVAWHTSTVAVGVGASGKVTPALWTEPDTAGFDHQTTFSGLQPGVQQHLWLQARDEEGQVATSSLEVVTSRRSPKPVASTSGDTILLDGQPFFPRMVWAACSDELAGPLAAGIDLFLANRCGSDRALVDALQGSAYAAVDARLGIQNLAGVIGWYYPDEWDAGLPGDVTLDALRAQAGMPPSGLVSFLTLSSHFYSQAAPLPAGRGMYPALLALPDVLGFDLYPLQSWCRSDAFAADYQAQRELEAVGKPSYQWIETAPFGCSGRGPTPETVRAEAWLAIAGGADGIGYFPGVWTGEIGDAIARTNAAVDELGSALLGDDTPASSSVEAVRVGARRREGARYVIAVNASGEPVQAAIQIDGQESATCEVYAERRHVAMVKGRFTDRFEPLAVHVYIVPPAGWDMSATRPSLAEDGWQVPDAEDGSAGSHRVIDGVALPE